MSQVIEFEGPGTTLRLLPAFLFCVAWQQSDLFWHLGLNKQAQSGRLLPAVGIANTLTWLRGLAASYLLARIIGGVGTPSWLAQCLYFLVLLTPTQFAPVVQAIHLPLLAVTLILLIVAPLAQILENVRTGRR